MAMNSTFSEPQPQFFRYIDYEKDTVSVEIHIFRFLFTSLYILLIISTIFFIRESETLSRTLLFVRAGLFLLIMLLWLSFCLARGRTHKLPFTFFLVFLPYLFTPNFLGYLDVLVLLILASEFQKNSSTGKYFIRLAYISLLVTLAISLLGWMSVIPSFDHTVGSVRKFSMGFSNPNTLYLFLTSASMVFFYYKKRFGFFLSGLFIIGFFPLVGSRTFLVVYVLLAILWIWPSVLRFRVVMAILWLLLFSVVIFGLVTTMIPQQVSYLISYFGGAGIPEIESIYIRLANAAKLLPESNIVFLLGGSGEKIDSIYVNFMSGFGLVGVLFFAYFMFKRLYIQVKLGRKNALVVALMFMTAGLAEAPFDGSMLISLVFISVVFFPDRNRLGDERY